MSDYIPESVKRFLLPFFPPSFQESVLELLRDVEELYQGKWPEFEPCDVPYHNLTHAFRTAETAMILLRGWEKYRRRSISGELRWMALAAALFHDSGYLKDRGDREGTGAKHTFTHVPRSARIAENYLRRKGKREEHIALVREMILLTDFLKEVHFPANWDEERRRAGGAVATADLLTQVSAFDYLEKLKDLFREFREAYRWEGEDKLRSRGIRVFTSYEEMLESSPDFFRNYVFPRFRALGNLELYARYFFPGGRNYFLEALHFNLALLEGRKRGPEDLLHQKRPPSSPWERNRSPLPVGGGQGEGAITLPLWGRDGEGAGYPLPCSPGFLVEAMEHLLPSSLLRELSREDLVFFLRTALLAALSEGPEILDPLLEILCDHLACEAATVFRAEGSFLRPVACAGPRCSEFRELVVPAEGSFCGWVLGHGRPALTNDIQKSVRFWAGADQALGFTTRNLLAVPLEPETPGRPAGVLELVNKSPAFRKADLQKALLWCKLLIRPLRVLLKKES